MKQAKRFSISAGWALLLNDMEVDIQQVLKNAQLPSDTFNRDDISLDAAGYFKFWSGLEAAAKDQNLPLLFAEHLSVEAFDPALFACVCSANLNEAVQRVSEFKPLIAPLTLKVKQTAIFTELTISPIDPTHTLPQTLSLTELVFFVQFSRLATRHEIQALQVSLPFAPANVGEFEDYFGCRISSKQNLSVRFAAADAARPFLTANAEMWDFFEGRLRQQLKDLDSSASTSDRVRAVLIETLPTGDATIETVSTRLAMSKRSLQRKLSNEAETYQSVLKKVRQELADHYLRKSKLQLGEISFMLGFREPNSFARAFNEWNGLTPGQYRSQ